MKTLQYARLSIIALSLMAASCKNNNAHSESTVVANNDSASTKTSNKNVGENVAVDILNILPEVGELNTKSQEGEYVLIPDYSEIERFAKSNGDEYLKYNKARMVKPGETSSIVNFTFAGDKEVPNHLILPIPSDEKVKKGDMVNTWWQSGSGMNRAIVIDDANPKEPVVNYIDIDWNNKVEKNGKTIGQLEEKLSPNSFVLLSKDYQPGTTVAYKSKGDYKKGLLIVEKNDKLLVLGFMGKPEIINKADSRPIPIKPKLKVGETVLAPRNYVFKEAVIEKVDEKYGRVHLKFKERTETDVIPFGDVIAQLNF